MITESIITIAGAVLINYGFKLGRAYPLIKQAYTLIKNQHDARKDKQLTQKEKVILYDDIEDLINESWKIISGFTPIKKL